MFITVSEKKFGQNFSLAMAKNFKMSLSEFSSYERLYKTNEKGIYATYIIEADLILNPLRYETVLSDAMQNIFFAFPKSILKREKRKMYRLGFTNLRDSSLHFNHYKDCIERNHKMNDIEKAKLLKNLSMYSVMNNYGIADNELQIKKRFKFLENSSEKYVILMEPIWRSQQPKIGGFRYYKHGSYIGNQDLRNEYLYDDKHVEKVFLFRVYQINEKPLPNFGDYKYKIVDNTIFNKQEEAVAIISKRDRKIIIGYLDSDENFDIPENIDIEDQDSILGFLSNQCNLE